jgi:serralysin
MSSVRTVALTGDASIDGLMSGVAWVGGVTYSFPAGAAEYGYTGGSFEPIGFVPLGGTPGQPASQAWIASRVFNEIADLIALTITPTAAAGADIRLAMTATPDVADFGAYAYYPGTYSEGGDAWFNTTDFNVVVLGSFGHFVFTHEIGHTFGLKHGHEDDTPWIIEPFPNVLPFDRDSAEFSVMTYRAYIGGPIDFYRIADGHGPQSLMMLDIRALQLIYGADHTTRAGNTTYRFDPNTGEMFIDGVAQGISKAAGNVTVNVLFRTVFDGNGTDTYDFSAYDASRQLAIDLRPGEWTDVDSDSNFQAANLGGGPNGGFARGQVANALLIDNDVRALIENAIGGAGDDSIGGNQANNNLQGRAGHDTLRGLTGDDTLDGGIGDDTLIGGAGNDTLIGGSGFDTADYSDASLEVIIDLAVAGPQNSEGTGTDTVSGIERLRGGSGGDQLRGDGADNRIEGGDGGDTIEGRGGNDALIGGAGGDTASYASAASAVTVSLLAQGAAQDTLGAGQDTLSGFENLTGSAFADRLTGDADSNTLNGLAGDDILKGGAGADLLLGGDGIDQALFDLLFAQASFTWDGTALLVNDGTTTDRLTDIESLVFSDRTVATSSITAPPPPPPPPADVLATVVFTNTIPSATPPAAFMATTPAPGGSISYNAATLGLAGVHPDALPTLRTFADGFLVVSLPGAWNMLKVARITDPDGGLLAVSNFVETVVTIAGTRDSTVTVSASKRGNVTTGAGNDDIRFATYSNQAGAGNTATIDSGAGNDTLTLWADANGWSVFEVQAGAGNDIVRVDGVSNDWLQGGDGNDTLEAADGNDRLKGGAGADVLDGGAGSDQALYDIAFASAQFSFDGTTLLVNDGTWTDRLDRIERLVFTDRSVDVATLAPSPPPPPPPPPGVATVVFTNTNATDSGPGKSFTATVPTGGTTTYSGLDLGIASVPSSAQIRMQTASQGELQITLDSAWNSVKVAKVTDADGGSHSVSNFAEVVMTLGGTSDSWVSVEWAKRGTITTDAGNDLVMVKGRSNQAGSGNTMVIDTKAGNDSINIQADNTGWNIYDVRGGAGNDRIFFSNGRSNDLLSGGDGDDWLDGGAGNDRLTGGAGADRFIGNWGGGSDTVTDFTDGADLIWIRTGGFESVAMVAVSGGVKVSWGSTDSMSLAGISLAALSAADFMFG